MKLIDLSHCAVKNEDELKIASLKHFLSENNNYNQKKLCEALDVSLDVLKAWIYEIKTEDSFKISEIVIEFKKAHPEISQRSIALRFGISLGSVNKYLKNFAM